MWNGNVSEFATRIAELQLEWLRAAGAVSAGLGVALALVVGFAIGRLVWAVRRAMRPHDRA